MGLDRGSPPPARQGDRDAAQLGVDARKTKYVAHSGGGEANAAILSGSVVAGVAAQLGEAAARRDVEREQTAQDVKRFRIDRLEERIAPSSANFPPGQFPSGNPAHAPGRLGRRTEPILAQDFGLYLCEEVVR